MTWYEEKYQWGVKALPKDIMGRKTTKEQWDLWLADMERFELRMRRSEPKMADYGYIGSMPPDADGERAYSNAMSEWNMALSCDRPNEPGYYRAAND